MSLRLAHVLRLRPLFLASVVAALLLSATSPAQAYRRYYGRGSTPYSSYANGMANSIRAQGAATLANAQAAIAYEQARTLYIQNREAATKAYFDMRQMNRDAVAAERGHVPSHEEIVRSASMNEPPRLSASQLDPVSGHIVWPDILTGPNYTAYRNKLDALFVNRAHHSSLPGESISAEIRETGHQMQEELRKHINELPNQEFEESHKFLNSLVFEVHAPAN
jgi:hypothetical protein